MSPNIVNCLVNVSEKAANIARVMRQHDYLFSLLVQEKSIDESNSERFVHDYKTLADVLIQQTVRHDIGVSVCKLCKFNKYLASISVFKSKDFL